MIFGIGIDMIEVDRVSRLLARDSRFLDRVFTERERVYCEMKKNKAQNYAARFAAKEAFLKAAGTGWRGGMTFRDVEVVNEESGKPTIVVSGRAKSFVEENGISDIQVSLTHIKSVAGAVVTLAKG